jgi:hypothetical protein
MSIQRNVTDVIVGNGAAITAATVAMNDAAAGQIGVIGVDMLGIEASTGTVGIDPQIFLANKLADGTFKKSSIIKGSSVVNYRGEHYVPSRRCVASIGYQRGSIVDGTTTAAAGSIEVNASTDYVFSIRFTNDKSFYAQRPEVLRVTFTSSASATQLSIATQIANAINNSGYGSSASGIKMVSAVIVGDGTATTTTAATSSSPVIYGATSATNYGVEITGLVINQFQNTQYQEELVNFTVHVDDTTGFGATTASVIQGAKNGTGTYNQVYNLENKYATLLNRRLWPAQTHTFLASSTLTLSGTVAAAATTPTGNVTSVANSDYVAVVTATGGLRPGEVITINAVEYTIKYIVSATKFVLTAASAASYGAGAELKVKYGYNIINISVSDVTLQDGSGVGQISNKAIVIATPAIDAAAADPFDRTLDSADTSAECIDIAESLDAWMATTPLAPANLTFA